MGREKTTLGKMKDGREGKRKEENVKRGRRGRKSTQRIEGERWNEKRVMGEKRLHWGKRKKRKTGEK